MHFSRQIKDQNSGRKLKNQTNDLIFSSTFSTLFVILIFVFKNSQNSFSCGPPFDPFWFVKLRNFQQKLPISTIHHTFIESIILCIIWMWLLVCSVQVYISLYFLPLWICNFPLSLYNKSPFFVRLITQSHSILLILLFNLFLFSLHKI